ncbi:MAG: hypothetical protein ACE5EO_09965, partial [Candidatus Krumholzibacteriia bacterium]
MARKLACLPAGVVFLVGVATLFVSAHVSLASDLSYTSQLSRDRVAVDRNGEASRVRVDEKGYDRLADAGLPALPYRVISFLLPQG